MVNKMIKEISYREVADNLHIDVMFSDCDIYECFVSVDELIIQSASPIVLNNENVNYTKLIEKRVKWCEEHFEMMKRLYYDE